MADYASACGFIQWEPVTRQANNQEVREFSIKTPGTDGVLIRVTVWPELQTPNVLELQEGDFVAVDGKLNVGSYEGKDGETRTSVQISASKIATLKGEEKADREVVGRGSKNSAF